MCFIILRWLCAVDRTLKPSPYPHIHPKVHNSFSFSATSIKKKIHDFICISFLYMLTIKSSILVKCRFAKLPQSHSLSLSLSLSLFLQSLCLLLHCAYLIKLKSGFVCTTIIMYIFFFTSLHPSLSLTVLYSHVTLGKISCLFHLYMVLFQPGVFWYDWVINLP